MIDHDLNCASQHCQWEWPCRTYVYAGGGA